MIPKFFSRPDLKSPNLEVFLEQPGTTTPAFIFVSPYFISGSPADSGPHIFDNTGQLIWSGVDAVGGAGGSDTQGLSPCSYQNSSHLCFWKGLKQKMYGSGLSIIMDQNYQIVKTIQSGTAGTSTDLHEFQLTTEDTAVFTLYQPRFYQALWILDSCFQEVDILTGAVLFHWCSLDHIDLSQSRTPNTNRFVGSGESSEDAWDYVHLNSIDKAPDGNFLISARHLDAALLISGFDGSIIWQLGGDLSDFAMQNVHFRRQHDVRLVSNLSRPNLTVVSLFNNDNDGFLLKSNPASGIIIELNHTTKTARELASFHYPTISKALRNYMPDFQSRAMGNMQLLSTGNYFLNFAENSTVVEYTIDGQPIWGAWIPLYTGNYRAYKVGDWVGKPLQPPALWTYSKMDSAESLTVFYVSWNGATEVARWRFWGASTENKPNTYEMIGEVDKSGFETNFTVPGPWKWAFVEAITATGISLCNSSRVRTYIPKVGATAECGNYHCFQSQSLDSSQGLNSVWISPMEVGTKTMEDHRGKINWTVTWTEHFMALIGLCLILMHGYKYAKIWHSKRTAYYKINQEDT